MRWLYIIACVGVLIWTTLSALNTMRLGYERLGAISAVVPIVWIAICSVGLGWFSALQLSPVVRVIGQTLLVTLALVGTVFGFVAGQFAALGFSYGNSEMEVVQAYPWAFGIGAALTLAPGAAFAVVAMVLVILQRAREGRTPGATP